MAVPDLAIDEAGVEQPESTDDGEETIPNTGDETESDLDEPEVMEVELTEDDFGGGLFTGVEDSHDDLDAGIESEPLAGEKADKALGLSDDSSNIDTVINEGAARLAVVGLDPEYKLDTDESYEDSTSLEAEFYEVFSTFRLGYFGAAFLDEYIFTDDDQVDPAWGLLGSMLCAMAVTVWMRPDGDEMVADFTNAIGGIGGSGT